MILVGLTGGIGAGKSTVSSLLATRGAVIVDADAITRDVQRPGQPVLAAIADRYGVGVLTAAGELDRAALAGIVFNDPDALKDLNALVHPAVNLEIARRVLAERSSGCVLVLDIPLLLDSDRTRHLAAVVVVDCPVDVAVDRLVRFRHMDADDARARISRQVSREDRRAKAHRVLDNAGEPDALVPQIDALWAWLRTLPAATDEDLAPMAKAVADAAKAVADAAKAAADAAKAAADAANGTVDAAVAADGAVDAT